MMPSANTAQPKPQIAVIDDDRSVLKSLARLLRLAGYTVEAYSSAPEILCVLAKSAPQCLIIDIQMPGINGFELLATLRACGCQAPAIFITAHDTPQTRASVTQMGAIDLLTKPFEDVALLAAVNKALSA